MVSQIVWLGVKDVFTQIAKDVVGQGLDHGTLTFKVMLVYDLMFTFKSFFVRLGLIVRRIFRRIIITHSFLERIGQPEVDLANDREESVPINVLDATFILEFSSSQMFSMLFRDSLGSTKTERNALMLQNFS
uniref:Uncharacterized protein n=1 Tax=Brassica oleracea var. oleracea TaxID=109376 RepID=A0A0D3DKV0_BRAOL